MNRKHFIVLLILFSMTFMMLSCKDKSIGYGTVLWSPDEDLIATGSTVTVISESELSDTYLVSAEGLEAPVQTERWRVAFSEEKEEADISSARVSEFINIYARNLRDGLLIRESPDINSSRVYKMRKDQILKVFDKTEELAVVGQYEGYWYRVLTEDGTSGYCFDHYLDVYDNSIKPEEKVDPAELLLEQAFSRNYYPQSFIDMISSSAIDLKRFNTQTGFFPDPENRKLRITTENYTLNFTWDHLSLIDKQSFELGDTGVEITVLSSSRLRVTFFHEGEKNIVNYHQLDGIEDIITAEIERREALYNELLETGTSFSSNAYGNIVFQPDGTFKWVNFDRLVPQIIPANTTGNGRISFDRFLAGDLKNEYKGAITFSFNTGTAVFLYQIDNGSLKLTYVPENEISEGIVRKRSVSPIIIAFSADR